MLLLEDLLAILHILPLLILVLLMGLELGVALIQAYVFTILTCIYLNNTIENKKLVNASNLFLKSNSEIFKRKDSFNFF